MLRDWEDLTLEQATAHVLGGGSCYVSGLAGTGKSYTVLRWVEELRKTRRVILTAPTHVACNNLRVGGMIPETLARLMHTALKYGTLTKDSTLVVDEISQINTST